MGAVVFYVLAAALLIAAFLKLLSEDSRLTSRRNEGLVIDDFLPIHQWEFKEVENRLSEYDELLHRIGSERRDLALAYLNSLRDDFVRVEELLNRAAKFLPEITLAGEAGRLWAGLTFRFNYRIASVWIRLGFAPGGQLKSLTWQVRILADWADKTLAVIAREAGLPALRSELNR